MSSGSPIYYVQTLRENLTISCRACVEPSGGCECWVSYLLCTDSLGKPYHFLPCMCRSLWMMWVLGLVSSMYRILGETLYFLSFVCRSLWIMGVLGLVSSRGILTISCRACVEPSRVCGCWVCYLVCTESFGNSYHFLPCMCWSLWLMWVLGLLSSMYTIFVKPLPFPAMGL
jgi:hypothetical protein